MLKTKKKLGQNFLKDSYYLEKISCAPSYKKDIVEIGAGGGSLTKILAQKALKHIYAVEIDKRFCSLLRKEFANSKKVSIICANILDVDLSQIGKKVDVIGNIPYYLSTKIISYLIASRNFIDTAYLTVQKEFAGKLCALAGDASYAYLSAALDFCADKEILFTIPKEAFSPRPRIDSCLMRIKFKRKYFLKNEKILWELLRIVFRERKKKIGNILNKFYPQFLWEDILAKEGIPSYFRPAKLTIGNYCALAKNIERFNVIFRDE